MDDRERRPTAPEEVVSELFFFEEAIYDGNYQGPAFAKDQKKAMHSLSVVIVNGPMLPRASMYCHGAGLLNTLLRGWGDVQGWQTILRTCRETHSPYSN